jgi:hypothetical protein
MITLLVTTLLLHADPALGRALDAAVAVRGAHVELLAWKGPGCTGAFEVGPVEASGRVPVRVRGADCDGWGWATVSLVAPGAVLTAEVRTGDSLQGKWSPKQFEVRRGVTLLTEIDATATATRAMKPGQPLTVDTVRLGPAPGTPLTVRVTTGGIVLEQRGTAIGCVGAQVCASLPTGRRVSGHLEADVLVVGAVSPGVRL